MSQGIINEWMSKNSNQNQALTKHSCHRHSPHTSLVTVQLHPLHSRHTPPYSHRQDLSFSLRQNTREEGDILFRTTLHHHPHAHWSSTSSFSSITIPLSGGSKTPRSLTQPQPYLASRTPRNSHADAEGALAFPRSAFLSQTASFLCWPSSHEIRTSDSDGYSFEVARMGMESQHCVAYDITPLGSLRPGVDSQSERTGEATARRHPASYPPQVRTGCRSRIGAPRRSYELARNVEEDGVCEG